MFIFIHFTVQFTNKDQSTWANRWIEQIVINTFGQPKVGIASNVIKFVMCDTQLICSGHKTNWHSCPQRLPKSYTYGGTGLLLALLCKGLSTDQEKVIKTYKANQTWLLSSSFIGLKTYFEFLNAFWQWVCRLRPKNASKPIKKLPITG